MNKESICFCEHFSVAAAVVSPIQPPSYFWNGFHVKLTQKNNFGYDLIFKVETSWDLGD